MKPAAYQTSPWSTLRVLAWLAWLLLAASPVASMPAGMMSGPAPVAHDARQTHTMEHGQTLASPAMGDRCHPPSLTAGHDPDPACTCASMSCNALPAMARVPLPPAALLDRPVFRHGGSAPAVAHTPPLRPPLG
ncbi:MAG TPA: hypothetical protein VLZ55_10855 [Rhodanobacter sp.]|nr:hypothetical protein [Rhodanobacter sp.]